jgi:hypothetical protein
MTDQEVMRTTGRLLFRIPALALVMILAGAILSLVHIRHPYVALTIAQGVLWVVAFFMPLFAIGRAASMLGSSWVYYGLLPLLFSPFGPVIAWFALVKKRHERMQAAP